MPVPTVTSHIQVKSNHMSANLEKIPEKCTVLVVGGGPGGSYAACALAREGVDVVLLEAEVFPRYHIGESMLASMRHLLRFVGMDEEFDRHGFTKKVGAAFKLNGSKREGYTDFLAVGGPDNYAWNVVRSEADELMLRHAQKEGVKVFEGIKVTDLEFEELPPSDNTESKDFKGRPLRASWKRKENKTPVDSELMAEQVPNTQFNNVAETGKISFTYIVDASGRTGLLNTKYLKNRTYNRGLKNVASWGYWTGSGVYARGSPRERSPFFEALSDESGWAWLIPLHNDTTSVGVVQNQDITAEKKKSTPTLSAKDFYLSQLKLAPNLMAILHNQTETEVDIESSISKCSPCSLKSNLENNQAELITEIRSASDYSYSSSTYAIPYARVVGDAGCFIDPYFSSGVHLALTSALCAAVTICAALRSSSMLGPNSPHNTDHLGLECCVEERLITEERAARWHSEKVGVAYTRFLMVVLSAYKQIRAQEEPILADFDEDNFDRAFALFRPVIQGVADMDVTMDVNGQISGRPRLSQEELSKTLQFCSHAFDPTLPEERKVLFDKLNQQKKEVEVRTNFNTDLIADASDKIKNIQAEKKRAFNAQLSEEEMRVLKHVKAREMMRTEDTMNISGFRTDIIDGLRARLERGNLGLESVSVLDK